MMKVLGERLRELRLEKGILQKDVGKAIGVAANTITGYETGTREPSLELLVALAKYYNTTTDYLLGVSDF